MHWEVDNRFAHPDLTHTIFPVQMEASRDLGCADCAGCIVLSAPESAANCSAMGHWSTTARLLCKSVWSGTPQSSISLVIWTETNDTLKLPLPTPARFQAVLLLFLFVCLFMYLKEEGIAVLMKSQYPAGLGTA